MNSRVSPLVGHSLRTPPANAQAEQGVLGGLLGNPKAYGEISAMLRAEHFADPAHGAIYGAIARRRDAGQLADAVLLAKHTAEWSASFDSEPEAREYLAGLVVAMVPVSSVRPYAEAVVDCWHRRALVEIGMELVEAAYLPGERAAREIHEAAEESLARLADGQEGEDAPVPAHTAMALAIDRAVKASQHPGGLVGLTTGLQALDDITGGLRRGHMVVVGARPSMGKTTLLQAIGAGAAQAGGRVLMVSMEMTAASLGGQLVAGLTPISRDLATRGKEMERDDAGRFTWRPVRDAEVQGMIRAQRAMIDRRLLVVELRARTMAALRGVVRRQMRRGGLDLVLIDYLGLLRVPELARMGNRVLEVTRLSGDIKAMAQDFDIPVVVASQLNREVESMDVKRPGLSHLRDTGAIEQDADVVMFLHRENYYLKRMLQAPQGDREDAEAYANRLSRHAERVRLSEGRASLFVDKQREGRVGEVKLAFGEETTWFMDLPDEGAP